MSAATVYTYHMDNESYVSVHLDTFEKSNERKTVGIENSFEEKNSRRLYSKSTLSQVPYIT